MKKRYIKRGAMLALALTLVQSILVMSAGASTVVGTRETLPPGTMGLATLYASVEIGNKSATATLKATAYCEHLDVKVTLFYGFGEQVRTSEASSYSKGVADTAIARTTNYNAVELGAEGEFHATHGDYHWDPPRLLAGSKS